MSSKTVKLGFIGCGYMGQLAHIANYALLPDVELVALADLRPETAKEVAKRYGIKDVFPNHKTLLDNADIDAVVAIMYFGLHHTVVPDILAKGKHCLTEKPIAIQAKTAAGFNELAKKKKVIYQIAYMKRCDPASRMMKEKIREWKQSKEFGQLNYLRVSMPPGDWTCHIEAPLDKNDKIVADSLKPEAYPDWMDKKTGEEYVSFVNYYIHQVNLIRYLLGEDYKVTYVDPNRRIMAAQSDSGVTILLEMNTYTLKDDWNEYYTACFEKGKLSLSLPAPMARQYSGDLRIYQNTKDGDVNQQPILPPKWSMAEQARLFIDAVQSKIPCISPAQDAIKDLQIAEEFIRFGRSR